MSFIRRRTPRATLLALGGLCLSAVAGCSATGRNAVPAGADEVEAGRGQIDYRAQRDGKIWVYDADADKMAYAGPIEDGQRIVVNPVSNQVVVGSDTVSEQNLDREHRYIIYFKRKN